MDDIFLSHHNYQLQLNLLIESDEHSIWAYLIDDTSNETIQDGFLCSKGTILASSTEVKSLIDSGLAPPISQQYANQFTLQPNIQEKDIKVNWSDETVEILLHEVLFLRMNWQTKKSFSRSVSTPGPYGNPLN